ncbi:RecR [Desulforapulum autotrophicum HRM2]|uniref:Recombination protein RecR n=1 Tax=Desulforapulum autotrophicum (strain ATCC 43914 / DSM 3382 / VKM B-1955 / HRM2) TaxID=177437 RepID=RECR_DESAH|nr:recombination mediator RecR [Desulforapulum autotrophicum]C0QAG9.1 RecName: Full=Recombination protein RecR [Desulforapulum autotrophicum HRM2]ACN14754.1 RecR [Desulforapulum autotrophicum HRM2]
MDLYPESILNLIKSLSTLPGIGRRTAERLALHILHAPLHEAQTLANDILELKQKVTLCRTCFSLSDQPECRICSNPRRDASIICVVEKPTDIVAIEKSGAFSGLYHVLGGALSPMDGIGPDELRIRELFSRACSKTTTEVIIATGTNVEGEATAAYISDQLRKKGVNVTRIASGVPMGGDFQYVDQVTMQRAMEGRRGF